ncbi:selenoprotein f [Anaeramoeba ignava]|uniref:Selenoprotein f n=1 Tax=Anaeramoeba ignava TaxID=1746090 RepID=A0A9Q0LAL5_ANAIG|nr:selenoprotein f [Anaeramoeba ignava]
MKKIILILSIIFVSIFVIKTQLDDSGSCAPKEPIIDTEEETDIELSAEDIEKLAEDIGVPFTKTKALGKARIRTGFGENLRKYPDIHKFVTTEGFDYSHLEVLFDGKDPELFVFDDNGNEIEKIDISQFTIQQLRDKLTEIGLKKVKDEL